MTRKAILSGEDTGRRNRCRHGARPYEHCSKCDGWNVHTLNLTDEELDVLIRALTFAADFHDDYYTLYPAEDYNRGNDNKQARGERILAGLRSVLTGPFSADRKRRPQMNTGRNVNATCQLFTPRLDTGERLALRLSDADWEIVNRNRGTLRMKGIVTDQNTGKRYRIKGSACGLSCCCDAMAKEVERES